jgi:ABC-2 type transport system permease protein
VSALAEVPGPSALGGGRRRSWELLVLLAGQEWRRSWFGTALGPLWVVCRPLLLFAILLVVFTKAFRLPADVEHYPVLLLLGIVLFGFFQEATTGAVNSIVAQEQVVRKTQFPRAVIPLALVLKAGLDLAANLTVVAVFAVASGVEVRWTWLLLPVLVLALAGLTAAVSLLVAALQPRHRDTAILWGVAVTALFYATPVLYPLEVLGEGLRQVLVLNPLAPVFAQARVWLIDAGAPGPAELAGGGARLLVPAALYALTCLLAWRVFRREAPRVAEAL